MPLINLDAVLNPLPELKDHTLDYIPRATTSEFGIVALGSGINVDIFGRIYLDTQEYSDRLTAIETTAASTLETTVNTLEAKADELAASITQKLGTPNGIATLDSSGQVPSTQLPSYVDDVLEYLNVTAFPATGETGKIYVETPGNTTYRWGGTGYVKITSGEVSSVAGKKGVVTLTKSDVGLSNVDNTNDLNKPLSTATQTALTALENKGKRGIINLYDTSLIYGLNERVVLANGDSVKSTVPNNTVDPNVDMTGWVKEPDANSLFRVNGKFVGLVPFSNISTALSAFLNNNDVSEIYLDGEYLLTSQIVVNAGVSPKKIFCSGRTILKPSVSGNLPLFDMHSTVEFYNPTFDYQNGNCFTTLRYRPNCGLVKLRDIKIKNIKDMVSSYGTIIFSISTEGNKLDIDGVSFENCLKLGNGSITDSAGSLSGIYYFGTTGLVRGEIKNIYAKEFHNINSSSQIIIEDTAVVYTATEGAYTPLTIENVIGEEFGKRLVKAQCSGVTFKNIRGTSTTGDSLSVLGILSEPGQFTSNNNIVSGVYARGNIDYAYADSGVNTQAEKLDIDLYGSNSLNDGSLHFGAYFAVQSKNGSLKNSIIKAKRPIGVNPTLVNDPIVDLNLIDVDLELKDNGNAFIDIPGNASTTNGAIKRLTAKLTLRTSATRTTGAQLINTFNAQKNYSDFDFDVKFIDKSSASNTAKSILGGFNYIKNLTLKAKFISEGGLAPDQLGDLATISNSSNVFVHVESEQKFNRGIIATANNGFKVSKDFKLGACSIGQVVATSAGTKYEVPDHVALFNGLTAVNEVLRGFGSTAQRPVNATIGFSYFDTTLGKVVNLKSANPNVWVDSSGATV